MKGKQQLQEENELIKALSIPTGHEWQKLFVDSLRELKLFLMKRYFWDEEGAVSIINDSYIVISEKFKQHEIRNNTITKSYIFSTCKNIGANKYRALLKKKNLFLPMVNVRNEYYNNLYDKYGIDLTQKIDNDDRYEGNWKQALRAFSILKEKCKMIIELRYVRELSHSEIVKKVDGINNQESSKTTLYRCIEKWKQLIHSL